MLFIVIGSDAFQLCKVYNFIINGGRMLRCFYTLMVSFRTENDIVYSSCYVRVLLCNTYLYKFYSELVTMA